MFFVYIVCGMKAAWIMHILHHLIFFPYQVREVEKNGLFFRSFLQEHRIDMVIDQDPQTYYTLYSFSKTLRDVYIISVIHYNPLGIYHHLGEFVMWIKGKNTIMGKNQKDGPYHKDSYV